MSDTKLILIGFGNVGRALGRLLLAKRAELIDHYQIDWRVVGIATKKHGQAINPKGIDLLQAIGMVEAGEELYPLSVTTAKNDIQDFFHSIQADVLFENTPVNYDTGQPAIDHIRTALNAGMHAITANKGPVVHAFQELTTLANSKGVSFRYESTVMDGAPIFSLWRETLPGADLLAFRGILNSTTNLILTRMEQGETFDQAVGYAQSIGIAETDPQGDTEGWDAAIKVAALVQVLMGVPLKPHQVVRQGIHGFSNDQVRAAIAKGRRWKLICQASRNGDQVEASVHPEQIEQDDPLYTVMGTSSAITFQSDVLGDLTITEADPGPHTTAYGLLADLINTLNASR
jgi:homoserine dehydrogenase